MHCATAKHSHAETYTCTQLWHPGVMFAVMQHWRPYTCRVHTQHEFCFNTLQLGLAENDEPSAAYCRLQNIQAVLCTGWFTAVPDTLACVHISCLLAFDLSPGNATSCPETAAP